MKKNTHVLDQLDRTESLRVEQHRRRISMRLLSLRVSIITLLLVACVGVDVGFPTQHAYAKSMCGILFPCPTPTPRPPTPQPTPTPPPAPAPAPSPTPGLQSSPTAVSGPVLAPTVTASASPTAIATATPTKGAQKIPVPDPTSVPVTHNQKTDSHIAYQWGGSGFSQMLMIIAIIFVCLFVVLAIGLLFFRRMLLPPIKMKLPASGISSWTRTLPSISIPGFERINNTQEAQPTDSSSFAPSSQVPLPDTAGVASASAETVSDRPANHSASPWYDIADDPFTT